MAEKLIKSACSMCKTCCGILVRVDHNGTVRVEGDPDNPIGKGRICVKASTTAEYLSSPDRLKHPIKRVGARGEGKWETISWDEALDLVADSLKQAKDDYGAESVLIAKGSAKGPEDDIVMRFGNAFGTPNISTPAFVCYVPIIAGAVFTFGHKGSPARADYEGSPSCILVWGANSKETDQPAYWETLEAVGNGSKLLLIDPRRIDLAEKADMWIQPRPGTDLALALGMLNVIIAEKRYDSDFVAKWTVGFDELKDHVSSYPPDKVSDITWIEKDKIVEIARSFSAAESACIQWGNGLEHNNNSFQMGRALWILTAITGNFGVPGGMVQFTSQGMLPRGYDDLTLASLIDPEIRKNNLSAEENMLPVANHLLHKNIIKAILEEDPYPIKAAFFQSSNPLVGFLNSKAIFDSLKKLDFICVADFFITPTAALADVVLPAATFLEYDGISAQPNGPVAQIQQKVTETGECWSNIKMLNELAKRLDIGHYFWETEEQCCDFLLKPIGKTFEELKQIGTFPSKPIYGEYQNAFGTPSGKVELYSERLEKWGFDPLPVYYELPETLYSEPDLYKEYPLLFTTGKSIEFLSSMGRQIDGLRKDHPDPVVNIHPETAEKYNVSDGEWVYIETRRGKIRQKARLDKYLDPRVIYADYGWWFPEEGPTGEYGWAKSNINVLTSHELKSNREMGTPTLRGTLCRIHPVK